MSEQSGRAIRQEVVGYLTFDGEKLPIVNFSASGALISCDPTLFEDIEEFETRIELRERGEKKAFNAQARITRREGSHVAIAYTES
ncbi:MAG: hypothetical protein NXI16_07280 [Alphaproteobacteria bacterium]|nr:hypothetical protein [Alphaproteobacteria bacterium]